MASAAVLSYSSSPIWHQQPDMVVHPWGSARSSFKRSLSLIGSEASMFLLYWVFGTNSAKQNTEDDTESRPPPSPTASSSSSVSSPRDEGSREVGDKRKRQLNRARGIEEDGEEQDSNETKKAKCKAKLIEDQKLLACPYFKRYPGEFSRSNVCVGPGWRTVYRLKEHLFRRHAPPRFQCLRCLLTFESGDALKRHLREAVPCEKRRTNRAIGQFNSDQQDLLRQRRKAQTEEEKWAEIYKILFPDADNVPSPYYDYDLSGSAEFIEFIQQKLPSLLKRRLETVPHLDQDTINTILTECRRCQDEVYELWQSPRPISACPSTDTALSLSTLNAQDKNRKSFDKDLGSRSAPSLNADFTGTPHQANQWTWPGGDPSLWDHDFDWPSDYSSLDFGMGGHRGVGGTERPEPPLAPSFPSLDQKDQDS